MDESGPIPLADEPEPEAPLRECPQCGVIMRRGTIICTACGFHTGTGAPLHAQQPAAAGSRCAACGYELTGLPTVRCPECGNVNAGAGARRRPAAVTKGSIPAAEFIRPAVLLGVGLLVSTLFALDAQPLRDAVLYLAGFAAFYVVGTAIFAGATVLWLGIDEPWRLNLLRLAGAFAIGDAAWVLGAMIPLPGVAYAGLVLAYFWMLADVLDLDLNDAAILTIVFSAARAGVALGVWWWLA